jgi:hypothetical protein
MTQRFLYLMRPKEFVMLVKERSKLAGKPERTTWKT